MALRNIIIVSVLIFLSLINTACVSIIDATTEEPLQIDPSKRSFGGYMDDRKLQTVIAVNIKKAAPELDNANISVHCYNGVVLLTGEVPTKILRQLAGKTARDVNKVRQVYNELTIASKTTFLSRANDEWIESRIDANLLLHRDIKSSTVKVVVEDNVVYLMGLLSKVQLEKITDVVKTTRGVKKVVRAVEYID